MYDAESIDVLRSIPALFIHRWWEGPNLSFRAATPDDAEFILSLRLDPSRNKHLSETPPDLEAQREWLRAMGDDQLYFIIQADHPLGTVRLYDQRGTSFCWGSWILSNDTPKFAAVETTLMVYRVGFDLGITSSHFDVRKANEKVWQYHERLGAGRVGETELSYLYLMTTPVILGVFECYEKRVPIEIEW